MSKTFKDAKDYPRYRKAKKDLSQAYLKFKRHGADEKVDDGEKCPRCGNFTEFAHSHLICKCCDWDDSGVLPVEQIFSRVA